MSVITQYELRQDDRGLVSLKDIRRHPVITDRLSDFGDMFEVFEDMFDPSSYATEHKFMMGFDTSLKCLGVMEVSQGTVRQTDNGARSIVTGLLLMNAVGCVMMHNHVGDVLEPSLEDLREYKLIEQLLSLFDIKLFDSMIICRHRFNLVSPSMKQYL